MSLENFIVNPVTLALIVLGVVEFVKNFGVQGKKLMIIAMVIGMVFAIIYKVRELYVLAQPFIDVLFFGVFVGLGASGIYSFVNARFPAKTATIKYTKVIKGEAADKEDAIR